ncbi:MAG: MBL fold metallo-hydrolase [Candidatus Bathyarchaeota archaeon]|nr:MBL fold metallo-hydrolase [Candidatus Bathyarchaeota archaeon]
MLIETFTVGMLSTNCYVAISKETKEAILIDPGHEFSSEAKPIFDYITNGKLKVKFIVNTHGHDDHIKGNALFQQKLNVPICIHPLDAHFIEGTEKGRFPANVMLEDGNLVKFGSETLKVMHTPGHTPGSISLVGEKLVFTGDTLFAGGIGRTDFPGGSMSDMRLSLKKLVSLPDYLLVYPGHGETSMIREEKRMNPFLNNRSKDMLF